MTKHWLENLPEAGTQIELRANAIKSAALRLENAKIQVKVLEYELSLLEKAAEDLVASQWTPEEIAQAKKQTA